MQECQRLCFQQSLIEHCDCVHPAFLRQTTDEPCKIEVAPNATEDILWQYECVMDVMEKFDEGTLDCPSCRPACSEHNYKFLHSYSIWPSEHFWVRPIFARFSLFLKATSGGFSFQPQVFDDYMGDFVWSSASTHPPKKGKNWKRLDEMEDYLEHLEDVQKDLLRLDVYFQSMTRTHVMEEPKYSVRTMLYCIT